MDSVSTLYDINSQSFLPAVRKMKFFLHPDKLPHDFSEKQSLLCKVIWEVTADAVEAENK
jgi:hypothetical protein